VHTWMKEEGDNFESQPTRRREKERDTERMCTCTCMHACTRTCTCTCTCVRMFTSEKVRLCGACMYFATCVISEANLEHGRPFQN
jgi:hypothetical protein